MSKARNLSKLLPDANGALPSSSIGTDAITHEKVADDAIGLNELSATGTPDSSKFLRGDNSWQVVAVTPTAVSDQANTSTGYFDMPHGTTAQRPASPNVGMVRFNTEFNSLEQYTTSGWVVINLIPVVSSFSGTVYSGQSTNITVFATLFDSSAVVRFSSGGTVVNAAPTSTSPNTSLVVSVPAAITNLSAGSTVAIQVVNGSGAISNSVTTTTVGLPTGGSISFVDGFRIHTFTSSGTLSVPTSRSAEIMTVAGGAAGGGPGGTDGAGGGGAGGLVYTSSFTLSATNHSVVVGAGGSGVGGGQGNAGSNSSFPGITTAIGGGGGGSESGTRTGGTGGSGGGGGGYSAGGGSGTAGQGNRGGDCTGPGDGGGGGAGGAGANGITRTGGVGLQYSQFSTVGGSPAGWFAGGGGASGDPRRDGGAAGAGGTGGGGNGAPTGSTPQSGVANTGGGGGGCSGSNTGGGGTSGSGGSGIVIVRYAI
jgi:hypothetical protein